METVSSPDVSVIIPIYNTMPYLRRCLDSVIGQTIGLERLQVIAVDDGSTDGSGELVQDLAERHPESFVALHQPNSGGPAAPCNRGLRHASGRWVFFLGADDYLASTALARLVDQGDEWDSDVIFGTMRGENGRFVDQRIYRRTARDITFLSSPLAYALANTKLFRRSLIEEHRIRFALDLRVGSDQPFVVEALTRARRISVLTDQVYYHAVKREEATNITYSMDWRTRLCDIAAVMDHIARVVDPGPVRDAIFARHFTWELSKLIRRDLPLLPESEQPQLLTGVAELYRRHGGGGLDERLGPRTRTRLGLVSAGEAGLLREVLAYQAGHSHPPLALRDDGCYLWSPGFGSAAVADDWYRITAPKPERLIARSVELSSVGVGDDRVWWSGRIGLTAASEPALSAELIPAGRAIEPGSGRAAPGSQPAVVVGEVRLTSDLPGEPASLEGAIPLGGALSARGPARVRYTADLRVRVDGADHRLPLTWTRGEAARVVTRGLTAWSLTLRADQAGSLVLTINRQSAARMLRVRLGRLRRSLAARLGSAARPNRETVRRGQE